jgi:hypothetical protein
MRSSRNSFGGFANLGDPGNAISAARHPPLGPNRGLVESAAAAENGINQLRCLRDASPELPAAGDCRAIELVYWPVMTRRTARADIVDRVAQFLDRGTRVDARDDDLCSTPLGWAAKFGRLRIVRQIADGTIFFSMAPFSLPFSFLVALRCQATPRDSPWATPLAWATRRGPGGITHSFAMGRDESPRSVGAQHQARAMSLNPPMAIRR